MQEIKNIRDVDVCGKRVLVRVNFNVPIENVKILDDTRIRATLPTLQLLLERGVAKIILLTHLGRPGGKVANEFSVAPLRARLGELIDVSRIELLENLRFDLGEEANDTAFAQKLANLGDLYVNDAFADSHRAHASIVGIPKLLPAYAGLLLEEEVTQLTQALKPPPNSLAIIGGAKLETKLPLIEKFAGLYKKVLVGGALANECTPTQDNISLPVDGVPQLKGMFDIGEQTRALWSEEIKKAEFVLWNGTVGMYEKKEYNGGTDAIAQALVDSNCRAVLGGGDTLAALGKSDLGRSSLRSDLEKSGRVFLSTGGGAMLQFLADGTLLGIEALKN